MLNMLLVDAITSKADWPGCASTMTRLPSQNTCKTNDVPKRLRGFSNGFGYKLPLLYCGTSVHGSQRRSYTNQPMKALYKVLMSWLRPIETIVTIFNRPPDTAIVLSRLSPSRKWGRLAWCL